MYLSIVTSFEPNATHSPAFTMKTSQYGRIYSNISLMSQFHSHKPIPSNLSQEFYLFRKAIGISTEPAAL